MSLPTSYRDLTILPIFEEKALVIACDTSAAIGQKEHDAVYIDPAITAAFCLRVPLLEFICFGAKPLCVVDLIGNEYEPTGRKILSGIKGEMVKAGLSDLPINGSTEENMVTTATSIGITLIGEIPADHALPKMEEDCALLQLGQPYITNDVVKNRDIIFSYDIVKKLKNESAVVDLLPVGSKGIGYEAQLMVENADFQVTFKQGVDTKCSAGPATVLLLAVKKDQLAELLTRYPELKQIGEFTRR
ncbi:hypothetical protein [Enterococcus sp. AZ109]|uniref:hypothetical protein n=1 Tax=Enterococcus sp. AZ109 TaxID=2774634 RepID=UPI003F283DAA